MKAVQKIVASLVLLGALASFASASAEKNYIASFAGRTGIPVPVSVVSPENVSAKFAGKTIELEFIVDSSGTPRNIRTVESVDAELAQDLVRAVSQWKFVPAQRDGVAYATKVVLPVRVTDAFESRFAAK